ncbi:MAG: RNA polymerase sigma-70 factor, partial [Bacteroidaceae bacterium]|nr:RNA polymerase sigma-70 factor [Bacteroidaceae bacterium]
HQWNDASLTMLYRHFYKALVVFSVQIVGEMTVAEDIVQDIFVKTWQKKNTFISEGTLKAYLYNAVRNESISHCRHQNVEQSRIQAYEREYRLMDADDGHSHEGSLHREEAYRQLLIAIEALPPKMRELFLMTIQGKTCEEIAQEMGITLHTVKKQRQRGLERLRKELSPSGLLLLLMLLN